MAQLIVMVESGGLGNQLFQYSAIVESSTPREKVLLFGFDQLKETFDLPTDPYFVHIQTNPLRHLHSLSYTRLKRLLNWVPLVQFAGGESAVEISRSERGLITLVEPSWFQTSTILDLKMLKKMTIKRSILECSQGLMNQVQATAATSIALHVRAGDYRTWPSVEYPALLPATWYREQVNLIRGDIPNLTVIALGDEPNYVDEVIKDIDNSVNVSGLMNENYQTDFGILSLCKYAVISASTFSLWARYFAKEKIPGVLTIGPEYWAGHRKGSWYPESLRVEFVQYR